MPTLRDTVKPWFVTAAKPTQAQFWALFDDLRFKDEAITLADIDTLAALLALKADQAALDDFTGGELITLLADGYYDVPAGYLLDKLIILPGLDMNIYLGKTLGGDEIAASELVTGGVGEVYVVNLFANAANVRLYISGITAATSVILFKRKVKLA